MAETVDFDRIAEYNEKDEDTLNKKIAKLAELIKGANYVTFYTGAGVSTSAGVPDYRGPTGSWTMRAQGKVATAKVGILDAQPTVTHVAMATMIKRGIAHYVVTTNLDGLFRKAGLEAHTHICNLHGCFYTERCTACGYEFERNYQVRKDYITGNDHHVGVCEQCGCSPIEKIEKGKPTGFYESVGTRDKNVGTKDTIINFGDKLDKIDWDECDQHCQKSDLVIVAGTSMTLRHITHFPFLAQNNKYGNGTETGKVVIINLQETPDDDKCDFRIWANCDTVFNGDFFYLSCMHVTFILGKKIIP